MNEIVKNNYVLSFPDSRMALFHEDGLYLTIANSYSNFNERSMLVRIEPVDADGSVLEYRFECIRSELILYCADGHLRFHISDNDILRVHGEKIGAKLYFDTSQSSFECCCDAGDEACEAMMFLTGKLLFVPIQGNISHTAMWNPQTAKSENYYVWLKPKDTMYCFDAAIHQYYSTGKRKSSYEDYKVSAENAHKHFTNFVESYKLPWGEPYVLPEYVLWSSSFKAGFKKDVEGFLPDKTGFIGIIGWQQALLASILQAKPEKTKAMIQSYMNYMTVGGALPGSIASIYEDVTYTCTPMFGYAINAVLEKCSAESGKMFEDLLDPLALNLDWWLHRWDENSIAPSYFNYMEAGPVCQCVEMQQLPIIMPDLLTWLILQCKACERLSQIKNDGREKEFFDIKQILIGQLLKLWDGQRFSGYSLAMDDKVKIHSVQRILPMLLSDELDNDIINKLYLDLCDNFLGDCGIRNYEGAEYTQTSIQYVFLKYLMESHNFEIGKKVFQALKKHMETEDVYGVGASEYKNMSVLNSCDAACWLACVQLSERMR